MADSVRADVMAAYHPRYMASEAPAGLVEPGNIDLMARPHVFNPKTGNVSTVYSSSHEIDGRHVLLPGVTDAGAIEDPDAALQRYLKSGHHLGAFDSQEAADAYGEALHQQQAALPPPPEP